MFYMSHYTNTRAHTHTHTHTHIHCEQQLCTLYSAIYTTKVSLRFDGQMKRFISVIDP